jgi:heat-inducible transcriptional repressor
MSANNPSRYIINEIPIKIKKGPSQRQKIILKSLIDSFIEDGHPVSSGNISHRSRLSVSPATIRIELTNLENQDLIYHPHTSAGCIPTDYGYRYFVDYIMEEQLLTKDEEEMLISKLGSLTNEYRQLIKNTVRSLSEISSYFSLGTLPNGEVYFSGLANLLREADPYFEGNIAEAIEVIDNFEQYIDLLPRKLKDDKIFIGKENPIEEFSNHAMIMTDYELQNWGQGLIAIIGPKRMPYQKIRPLLGHVSDFISGRLI